LKYSYNLLSGGRVVFHYTQLVTVAPLVGSTDKSKVIPVHYIKAYGNGGISALILNLVTKWRSQPPVSAALAAAKGPRYPFSRRLRELQRGYGQFGEALRGSEPRFLSFQPCILYVIVTGKLRLIGKAAVATEQQGGCTVFVRI
jgi:hypothetical protein